MRVIIGYGNTLRGEDAFGIDVIRKLKEYSLENTKLIEVSSLVPELILELLEANEVHFIDACYDESSCYKLACSLNKSQSSLSHHTQPEVLVALLDNIYHKKIHYEIHSMCTHNFDFIHSKNSYEECIQRLISFLLK